MDIDAEGLGAAPAVLILSARVDQTFSDEDFNKILPFTHLIEINGEKPYVIDNTPIGLEQAQKAQNMGWLSFHLTYENARAFTHLYSSFVLRFSCPPQIIPILDRALPS
ncbi:MAG: hypothetical protein C0514_03010 [Candidatus Puniceispirillum sp.]|nr:hypothetical protein [Candidatus Puniceispirillum sp.]